MNNTITIAWREFRAYFLSPIAYVYLTAFLVAVNWLFFRGFFIIGKADMRIFFEMMPWIFLFLVPAVTMGKWAEERRQGTLETLMTLPVSDSHVVLGKFLAGLWLVASALALTWPAAITVWFVGNLDWGPVIGGYAGALLLGGSCLALGLCVSSLTRSQIVAFVGGVAAIFVLLIVGSPLVIGGAGTPLTRLLGYSSLGTHFVSISRGVIDSRDVLYYLSFMGFFLFLNLVITKSKARG